MNVKELKIHMLRGLMRPEYFYIPVKKKNEPSGLFTVYFSKFRTDGGSYQAGAVISLALFGNADVDADKITVAGAELNYKGFPAPGTFVVAFTTILGRKAEVRGLPPGNYYYYENTSPEDYELDRYDGANYFTITAEGKCVDTNNPGYVIPNNSFTIYNRLIIPDYDFVVTWVDIPGITDTTQTAAWGSDPEISRSFICTLGKVLGVKIYENGEYMGYVVPYYFDNELMGSDDLNPSVYKGLRELCTSEYYEENHYDLYEDESGGMSWQRGLQMIFTYASSYAGQVYGENANIKVVMNVEETETDHFIRSPDYTYENTHTSTATLTLRYCLAYPRFPEYRVIRTGSTVVHYYRRSSYYDIVIPDGTSDEHQYVYDKIAEWERKLRGPGTSRVRIRFEN